MNHKFDKAVWDAVELKKKNGKDGLRVTQMNMTAVPALRDAVKLLLDAEGIEYLT